MILWLIGISGAGKTTAGRELVETMRRRDRSVLFIDGDEIRTVWKDDLGHTIEARRRNHSRLSQLCKVLDQDGVDIVVSALSIFPDLRAWNRRNLRCYLEVFLDLPIDEASKRDPKGIYARRARGESSDVVGVDIPFPVGDTTDLRISMPEILESPVEIANRIMDLIDRGETRPSERNGAAMAYRYTGRDLFETPETYEFAPCQERAFFSGWETHRAKAMTAFLRRAGQGTPAPLRELVPDIMRGSDNAGGSLQALMSNVFRAAETTPTESPAYLDAKRTMDEIVKKFEIFRRLFNSYDGDLRKAEGASVADVEGYCAFGAALIAFHRRTGVPIYSSTLLKLVDALLSRGPDDMTAGNAGKVTALLQGERAAVNYWERHADALLENREGKNA